MKAAVVMVGVLVLAAVVAGKTYFKETFDSDDWESRWTVGSEWKPKHETGKFVRTAGKWYGSEEDTGIQTSQDARFYTISTDMEEFDNKGKDLIVQYVVKHEQSLDCGGAYIKLLPGGFNKQKFGGDTPYAVMFGPDICGTSTRRTHLIFNYKGQNLLSKKEIRTETDQLSHLYTLIVRPDNTYEVQIDQVKVESGKLADDWEFLPAKQIKDPSKSKPADWVDEAKIPDPAAVKPEGWDDIPKQIPDPDAVKPSDWDDESDGEWEAPMIDNPAYKGEWEAPMIPNPDYKGPWVHPMIDNPAYFTDDELYHVCHSCAAVGFELWQVKSGTIFDSIIVTDSLEEAEEFAAATWAKNKSGEKSMYDTVQEEKRKKEEEERKQREADAKAAADKSKTEDEEEDDGDL